MRRSLSLFGLLLTACAVNPYAQFYQGTPDARVVPGYETVQADLLIYGTTDFRRDTDELMRRGYIPVGQSSFNAAANQVSEYQLREQAARIGAHSVLVASKYSHTVSGALPLVIPQTTTSYSTGTATAYGSGGTATAYGSGTTTTYGTQTTMVPYSVARSDFGALYFVKVISRVGIIPEPLDDETRQRLETNSGLRVRVVAQDSTAFLADILPGDVLLAMGADAVRSLEHYYKLIDKYEGQTIVFQIDRRGKRVEKKVEVRPYPKPTQPR